MIDDLKQYVLDMQTEPPFTHAQVLERLPRWMVADFDCLAGPHNWLELTHTAGWPGVAYSWCRTCQARRRRKTWPDDTRDPLAVIYDLQFGR